MTTIVTISSQGQIILPKALRSAMKLKPGDKVRLRLESTAPVPQAVIEPTNIDWAKAVRGIAKGAYGPVPAKWLENERNSWDR